MIGYKYQELCKYVMDKYGNGKYLKQILKLALELELTEPIID